MNNLEEYYAITRGGDADFPMLRTAVMSFIDKNRWFTGKIIILTDSTCPINSSNLNVLRQIYPNLEKMGVSQVDDLRSILSIIDSKGSIYFSNRVLFLGEVSNLLHPSSATGIIGVDPNDPDLAFFPKSAMDQEEIEFVNPKINTVRSSQFVNSRYANFVSKSKTIDAIIMDTFSLPESSEYSKIHAHWRHANSKYQSTLRIPVEIDPSKIRRAKVIPSLTESLNPNTKYIIDLDMDHSEEASSKKLSVCTICNDSFTVGAMVMIKSFTSNNKWFNQDIIVFHNKRYSNLSQKNMNKIKSIYDKVQFREIQDEKYQKVFDRFTKVYRGRPKMLRFLPSLFTYEVFDLSNEYDQVLFLDADMLIRSDISEIFSLKDPIIVTPDAGEFDLNRKYSTFNGGFILVNSNDETKKHRDLLLEHSLRSNKYQLFEQSMMNEYFRGRVSFLDSRYNCLKRCFPDSKFSQFDDRVKIIHYVGAKPWNSEKRGIEATYRSIEKMWHDEFKIDIN
jgi:lipopolysaccharide biosynthesis glycosyltransferase